MCLDMNSFLQICFLLCNFKYTSTQLTVTPLPNANLTYEKPWTTLERKLLSSYVRSVRPVKNDSTRTIVKVLPTVYHIGEVNEEEQTMSIHGYLRIEWYDEFLTWDMSEFSGLDKVTLNSKYIWQPDIMLYNSASGTSLGLTVGDYSDHDHLWLYHDGKIIYYAAFSLKATCLFDYSDYPYDIQQCPLIFGSRSYTLKNMEIKQLSNRDEVQNRLIINDTKTAVSNWEVVKVYTGVNYFNALNRQRKNQRPPESEFHYTFTEFYIWIKIKRWAPYFDAVVLMPAVMTSLFTLGSFLTTSYTNGIILLMINVMAQAVFTDDLIQKLPASNGSIPRIVLYFSLNLTITVVSMFILGTIQILTRLKSDRRVPTLLRYMVYGRRFVSEKMNHRFKFVRHIDEDVDEDETLSENVQNQQQKVNAQVSSLVSWLETGNMLKIFFFVIFSLFYLFSMFILLC